MTEVLELKYRDLYLVCLYMLFVVVVDLLWFSRSRKNSDLRSLYNKLNDDRLGIVHLRQ